ncbi:MAG: hypothetical protein IT383_24230 [Deltaproteobacteria bacterium]|nr:hypothetical protein [Deltaproteobacteria bacterium]
MDTSHDPMARQLAQGFECAELGPDELHGVIPFLLSSSGGTAPAWSPALPRYRDACCRDAGIDASLAPQDMHATFHRHPPSAHARALQSSFTLIFVDNLLQVELVVERHALEAQAFSQTRGVAAVEPALVARRFAGADDAP